MTSPREPGDVAATRKARVLANRFELISVLGAGGMGTVHRARDLRTGRIVALKMMNRTDSVAVLRFKAEFRGVADIRHPNLIRLGDLVEAGGVLFFTMELVRGVTFLAWVRPGGALHEDRLRRGLRQLVEGLRALHDAGQIHRDIKPSNVMVTAAGRVVILDFGLSVRAVGELQRSDVMAAGTVAYMAPEQAASRRVGPAADWYSVGVLLHEALSDRLPFDGTDLEILDAKLSDARSPPPVCSEQTSDLAMLCDELLRRDPEARPAGPELTHRLAAAPSMPVAPSQTAGGLVGRTGELGVLLEALEESRDRLSTHLVVAPSGEGKTALLRAFFEGAGEVGDTLVLSGRCHDREAIPFNAFDDVADRLAKHLAGLARTQRERLLPREPGILALLFPTLCHVPEIADALHGFEPGADAQETRRRAFDAFRELLARIAELRPLVVAIDGLHRANRDSLDLLAHVLQPLDPPRLMLLATARPGAVVDILATLAKNDRIVSPEVMQLPPLDAAAAEQLARRLVTDRGEASDARVAELVEQAAGNPGLLLELARESAHDSRIRSLDDLAAARLAQLSPVEQRLVGIVMVAGTALSVQPLALAVSLTPRAAMTLVDKACDAHLLSIVGGPGVPTIEPVHDRIAEAIVRLASADELRDWHESLATALERTGEGPPDAVLSHRLAAGVTSGVSEPAATAARGAAQRFELRRAAELYRIALAHFHGGSVEDRLSLELELANVLAHAGEGVEAAAAYSSVASRCDGIAALDARRRAADQLLVAGYIPEAFELYREILLGLGAPLLEGRRGTLARLVFHRARARLALLRAPRMRTPTENETTRLEAFWSVGTSLATIDTMRGAEYQARYIALVSRVGSASQVVRGLALEAAYAATAGIRGWRRAQQLLDRGARIAAVSGGSPDHGWLELGHAIAAFISGEFSTARSRADGALAVFSKQSGATWERRSARIFGIWACYFSGDLAAWESRTRAALHDAQLHGDRFSSAQLRLGICNAIWLLADRPDDAERQAAAAIDDWAPLTFQLPSYYHLVSVTQTLLYQDRGDEAHETVTRAWNDLDRSMLLQVDFITADAYFLRGRTAIAAAAGASGTRRRRLLAEAKAAARIVRARASSWHQGFVDLLAAGIACLESNRRAAVERVLAAKGAFAAHRMTMHEAVAEAAHASLLGRPSPTHEVLASVHHPERWCRMLAAGLFTPV